MDAKFIISAVNYQGYPETDLPEVAFCGRSNVGKSTMLNKLVNRKKLAKTSQTPGKTQLINFFNINNTYVFADLPGYGYAKVSRDQKKTWDPMMAEYFKRRENLRTLAILLDCRRDPNEQDKGMLEMAYEYGIQPILVLTKVDKFSKSRLHGRINEISAAMNVDKSVVIPFSATKSIGVQEVFDSIHDRCFNSDDDINETV